MALLAVEPAQVNKKTLKFHEKSNYDDNEIQDGDYAREFSPGTQWTQHGIVSFGAASGCEVGLPAGYTRSIRDINIQC